MDKKVFFAALTMYRHNSVGYLCNGEEERLLLQRPIMEDMETIGIEATTRGIIKRSGQSSIILTDALTDREIEKIGGPSPAHVQFGRTDVHFRKLAEVARLVGLSSVLKRDVVWYRAVGSNEAEETDLRVPYRSIHSSRDIAGITRAHLKRYDSQPELIRKLGQGWDALTRRTPNRVYI